MSAIVLSVHLEFRRDKLGHVPLWELIKAAELVSRTTVRRIPTAMHPTEKLRPFTNWLANWGLHLIDVNLAMGNLVDLVGQQAKVFAAKKKQGLLVECRCERSNAR